ncbi:MAG: hypothetical protein L3J98_15080, partial [Gammaproteobacteria bacterium]|nr:hypothetical protein [Gammaproteobacteria bacterium]
MLGNQVGLLNQSIVNASGANGGGQVQVGGDYRGENSGIRNASGTFVGGQTRIYADAINNGDGGRVIIWANDSARVYGSINARGGREGGHGGFVETSADVVDLNPLVDVSASNGDGGQWLIDPYNITIKAAVDGGETAATETNPISPDTLFTRTDGDSVVTFAALGSALENSGVTVRVETAPSPSGVQDENAGVTGNGNITIAEDFNLDSYALQGLTNAPTLELVAHRDVIINGRIYDSSGQNDRLNITLTADANNTLGGDVLINNAIETNGGNFVANGKNITINVVGANGVIGIETAGGNIDLNASDTGLLTITNTRINTGGGDFVTSGLNLTSTQVDNASALELRTNGGDANLVMSGVVNLGADIDTDGGNITIGFDDADNDMNDVFPASITVTALLDTIGANNTIGGNISLYSSGTINTDAGTLDARGGMATGTSGNRTGRNGGEVSLQGADITLGMVNTSGSNSNGSTSAGAGDAGTITLISTSATGDVVLNGMLTAEGGNGPGGNGEDGDAGDGKLISISAGQDVIANASLSSNGGAGPAGGDDGDGGNGGGVMIVAGRHVFINAGISSDGGNATVGSGTSGNADGNSGNGGSITLTAMGDVSINALISSNGGNGPSGDRARNGNGGDANDITVIIGNNLTLAADISALGGDRTAGSGTGADGADAAILIEGKIDTNTALDNVFTINDNVSINGLSAIINGLDGNDTLVSGETENAVWTIDDTDTGLLNKDTGNADLDIRFNQIESLTGNVGQDDFQFTANASATGTISGLVDGAGGSNDSLRFTGDTTDRVVQLGALTIADAMADPNLNITGVEEITAQDAANNILIADNVANTWNISNLSGTTDGINDGSVGGVTFENFDNLTGNADTDEFLIDTTGSVARIDGGTGTNTLTAPDTDNTWAISATNNRLAVTNGDIYVNTFTNIDTLAGGNAVDTFEFTGGSITGTAEGRGGNDFFILSQAITQGQLEGGDDNDTFRINANVSGNSQLRGGAGDDLFDVADGVSVTTTLVSGIAVLGGADNDTLDFGDVAQDVNWNITTSTGGGNITDTASIPVTIAAFDEMENLIGSNTHIDTFQFDTGGLLSGDINAGGGADVFNFNGGTLTGTAYGEAGSDRFTVSQAISQGQLDGGIDNDTFELDADVAGAVTGGEGVDTFTITADITGVLNGNAGNDIFNMDATTLAITDLNGGADSDTLNGNDSANIWTINAANSGSLVNDGQTTTFSGMENLTGGTDTDDFTVTGSADSVNAGDGINTVTVNNGGSVTGAITTGAGNDTIVLADTGTGSVGSINSGNGTNDVTVNGGGSVTGTIITGTDNDTITIAGIVTSIDAGDGINGIDVSGTATTITTGSAVDTINISGSATSIATDAGNDGITISGTVSGVIDGGGAADTLTITRTGNQVVQLGGTHTGTEDFTVNNVETIDATNSATGNTLRAANGSNIWEVSAANSGEVTGVTFSNFANLSGGTGNDTFTIDAALSSITTGNGSNSTNIVTINNGGIVSGAITGGDGRDNITVNTGGSTGSISTAENQDTIWIASTVVTTGPLSGGSETDTLTVNTSGNIWALTNATDGTVTNNGVTIDFSGFESLNSALGSTDTLDYSLVTDDINIDLNSLTGFDSIIGNYTNGGTYTASITGWDDTTNSWLIGEVTINATTTDGLNDGTVSNGSTTITFENFDALTGGDGN